MSGGVGKGPGRGPNPQYLPRGALLESSSDFGINRVKLIIDLETLDEPLTLEASIRWHAVSPEDETDHYGLVFRNLDDETQEKLYRAIDSLAPTS